MDATCPITPNTDEEIFMKQPIGAANGPRSEAVRPLLCDYHFMSSIWQAGLSVEVATEVPASACRIAYRICSSENFDRLIGHLLSSGTAEAVSLLQFKLLSFSEETLTLIQWFYRSWPLHSFQRVSISVKNGLCDIRGDEPMCERVRMTVVRMKFIPSVWSTPLIIRNNI